MPGIRIVTDSACDLSDELLSEHAVEVVPLTIRFGDEELVDRRELSTKEFWARCSAWAGLPETAAPSPGEFRDAFDRLRTEGASGIVCVNLSSRLSATIEAARQGAREVSGDIPVRIVDSRSATMGEGLVVLEAAACAAAGGDLDGVVAAADAAASSTQVYGAIDTLENLHRGGRIGGAQAFLGSLLAIKPVIVVRDGVVDEESKQRTRARSLAYLAAKVHDAGALRRLAVCGADASDLDRLVDLVRDVPSEHPMVVGDVGPVIGTHTGRGAVGVTWIPASA
jgi:DegV family protein with EDD domain